MRHILPEITAALWRHRALVLSAEPGAGKTTLIPLALAQSPHKSPGQIWVLQPRRLAARMAAAHVARGLGEAVGQRVGYRVRYDDATGPQTQIVYMTEGLMWRLLLQDCALPHVACVVFDEFHERTMVGDVVLGALLHRRQRKLPGPALLVMSATLAAEPIAALLGDAPLIHVPGRQFPVTITHAAHKSRDRLEVQVARGVAQVLAEPASPAKPQGHILVFLPGSRDIERAQVACRQLAATHNLMLAPLHASLPPAQQDAAVAPSAQRRLILATNVAETSLTIDGVTHVIDTGLAKTKTHDPLTQVGCLTTGPISQAAATQRAGRAGRTAAGFCLRLYTQVDFRQRPPFSMPELLRMDLAEAVLWLAALDMPDLQQLPLIDTPAQESVTQAVQTLVRLGAWHNGTLTPLGHTLLAMPLHPRLGRVVHAAHLAGIGALGCRAAAVLNEDKRPSSQGPGGQNAIGTSDLYPLCAPHSMSAEARRVATDLYRGLKFAGGVAQGDEEDALAQALLHGYNDRLVRRMPPLGPKAGALPLALGWGGQGSLAATSCVRDSTLMLALMAERLPGAEGFTAVHIAQAIAPDALLALDDGRLQENNTIAIQPGSGRIERVEKLTYGGLLLHQERSNDVTQSQAQAVLMAWLDAHPDACIKPVRDSAAYQELLARLIVIAPGMGCAHAFAADADAPTPVQAPPLSEQLDAALRTTWSHACTQVSSLTQLQQVPVLAMTVTRLTPAWTMALAKLAPENIILSNGRKLRVTYAVNEKPHVASFLQDFFGSAQGPVVGTQKMPVTLHLWGPNRRDLQVTSDLSSFWRNHYPSLRKALARRYPRHAWPEDPLAATPPPPRAPRHRKP